MWLHQTCPVSTDPVLVPFSVASGPSCQQCRTLFRSSFRLLPTMVQIRNSGFSVFFRFFRLFRFSGVQIRNSVFFRFFQLFRAPTQNCGVTAPATFGAAAFDAHRVFFLPLIPQGGVQKNFGQKNFGLICLFPIIRNKNHHFQALLKGGEWNGECATCVWQERVQARATQMTQMPSLKPLCLLYQNQGSLRHRRVICESQRQNVPPI